MGRRSERGVVLLLSMLVLMVLIIVVSQMAMSSAHNKSISVNYVQDLQNSYALKSAYYHAVLHLKHDLETAPKVDSLHERWSQAIAIRLNETDGSARIVDESSKINVSYLIKADGKVDPIIKDMLVRLVRMLEHSEEVVDRIIDYIDADQQGDFEKGAKNAALFTVDEIVGIEGLKPEVLYGGEVDGQEKKGIIDFVTVWPKPEAGGGGNPEDSKININTAPFEVIMALSEKMTTTVAGEVVSYRSQVDGTEPRHFKSVAEVKNVPGMTDEIYNSIASKLKVASRVYSIEATGRTGTLEKRWLYLVTRDESKKAVNFVTSYKLNRYITLKPEEQR